mmetsp:Transcript_7616/g.18987  ORF Transcript_7616/g.18987 Transcript_7616/m.18987 type:complete len:565 (+) Transcript_7616:130-1824(+)
MFDWIISRDDIIHWFQIQKQLCGGTSSTTTGCDVDDDVDEADRFRSPGQNSKARSIKQPELLSETPISGDDSLKDYFFLEKLRSNPSLIRNSSNSLNLSESRTSRKKLDQNSIGSLTLPSSDDGDDELQNNAPKKKTRCCTRFRCCVVLAMFLALFSVALAFLIVKPELLNIFTGLWNKLTVNTNQEQQSEGASGTYDYRSNSDYLVGTYYYPWHGDEFHNGGGYLRRNLTPPQQPALGEYNDSDPQIIAQHMKWFRKANIGLLVTSWWGPGRIEDTNTKDVILQHEDIGNLKIALHYETTGRIKGDMSTPRSDIKYICENYFDNPNYYKIDGRPVLFVYVTRVLHRDGVLEEALLTMRSEASKCGHNLYLIGDHVFQSAPDPNEEFVPFWYFDAVTNYDVYGSSGRPDGYAGKDAVETYYAEQEKWKNQALEENCRYVPPVSPGYNDRGVRLDKDNPPLSRRLTADSDEGSLFWYQLKNALQLVDPLVDNMVIVNSFNEWHEDTQIEPAVVVPGSETDGTTEPELYTGGLEYVGYGELYLEILGAMTSRDEESKMRFDHLIEI